MMYESYWDYLPAEICEIILKEKKLKEIEDKTHNIYCNVVRQIKSDIPLTVYKTEQIYASNKYGGSWCLCNARYPVAFPSQIMYYSGFRFIRSIIPDSKTIIITDCNNFAATMTGILSCSFTDRVNIEGEMINVKISWVNE